MLFTRTKMLRITISLFCTTLVYLVLLGADSSYTHPYSIKHLTEHTHWLHGNGHLLVIAGVPFYIAGLIFGTMTLCLKLSSLLESFFSQQSVKNLQ